MSNPTTLHLQITERCNLACPGCYLPDRTGPLLSPGILGTTVFAPLAQAGVRFITITGGEPLLHPEVADICAAAASHFSEVQVVSNGLLLSAETFAQLHHAGVTAIKVSLDGAKPATHDALRGKAGAFERLCANLRAVMSLPASQRQGVEIGAITTVQPANVHQLADIAALVRELGLAHLLLQPLHPFDPVYPPTGCPVRRPSTDPAYLDALRGAMDNFRTLSANQPGFIDNTAAMLDRMVEFHTRPEGPRQRCGANRFVFVNSHLDVRGCLFCNPLGNLSRATPQDIFTGKTWKDFQRFRARCTLCLMGCQFYETSQRLTDRGFALLQTGRPDMARRLFQAALSRGPALDAAHGLALAERLSGNLEAAASQLEALAAQVPHRLIVTVDWAEAVYAAGHVEQALAISDRADPLNPLFAGVRGLALRALGRFEEAVAAFAVRMEHRPEDMYAGGNLCSCLRRLGRVEEAVATGRRAVATLPASPHAWHQLALALCDAGQLDEAARAFAAAMDLKPDQDYLGGDACSALRRLGRVEEAVAAGRRAVTALPQAPHAWHQLGLALCDAGRLDEAARAFAAAMDLEPGQDYLGGDACSALRRLGRLEEAESMGKRAVAHAPGSAHAHHQYGLALAALGRHAAALEQFLNAADLEPEGPWIRFDLGMGHIALGETAAARPHFEAAVRLDPQVPWFHYRLALTLEGLDQTEAALRQMRLAVEHGPGEAKIRSEFDRMASLYGETSA